MKYIKEYLETVVKIKPLGELTTKEDELNGLSGEMVYIDGKCSDIFISHADYANWLERKYEQKSVVTIPKFKVGDWVVYNRDDYSREVIQVYDIRDGRYYFNDNIHFSWSIKECDEKSHLWSIEDAKDGDVLVSQHNQPFIYNGNYNDYRVGAYCGIEYTGEQFIDTYAEICWTDNKFIKPATKEQRELLFQKMKEAGYAFEKKELKKIGPKFKIGDWIVSDCNNVAYIESISETKYNLQCKNGYHEKMSIEYIDRCWHLWTIRDAKDGDVLATKDAVFIFKHMDKAGLSLCKSYCEVIGNSKLGFGFDFSINNVHPATKEQRDILFQKMKEAGYEWDVEKKELKKIEDEEYNGEDYGIDSLYHAQRILEKTLGKVEGYQTDDGIISHQCAITAIKKLYEQKPTEWSQEAEKQGEQKTVVTNFSGLTTWKYIVDAVLTKEHGVGNYLDDPNTEKFAKELQERFGGVEQKPTECIKFSNEFENQISHLLVSVLNGEHEYNEGFVKYVAQSLLGYAKNELKPTMWSEEDEKMFNSALWHIKNSCSNGGKNSGEFEVYNWLKSIKERIGG